MITFILGFLLGVCFTWLIVGLTNNNEVAGGGIGEKPETPPPTGRGAGE